MKGSGGKSHPAVLFVTEEVPHYFCSNAYSYFVNGADVTAVPHSQEPGGQLEWTLNPLNSRYVPMYQHFIPLTYGYFLFS